MKYLVKIAIQRAQKKYGIGKDTQVFHFGDAPQDMSAARMAGVASVGVTTGIFSAAELKSAGASIIFPNLIDTDGIMNFLLNGAG